MDAILQVISYYFYLLKCVFWGYTSSRYYRKNRNISLHFSSTIINFGAVGSDWIIKFGVLVNFFVLIDYLVIMSFPGIGASNFSFASFLLSLDDYESLVVSSLSKSPLAIFYSYFLLLNNYTLKGLTQNYSTALQRFYMFQYLDLQ